MLIIMYEDENTAQIYRDLQDNVLLELAISRGFEASTQEGIVGKNAATGVDAPMKQHTLTYSDVHAEYSSDDIATGRYYFYSAKVKYATELAEFDYGDGVEMDDADLPNADQEA